MISIRSFCDQLTVTIHTNHALAQHCYNEYTFSQKLYGKQPVTFFSDVIKRRSTSYYLDQHSFFGDLQVDISLMKSNTSNTSQQFCSHTVFPRSPYLYYVFKTSNPRIGEIPYEEVALQSGMASITDEPPGYPTIAQLRVSYIRTMYGRVIGLL